MHPSLALLGLAAATHAHFVLQIPTSLGFDDGNEGTAPCGGFDPTNRSTVSDWDVDGDNIGVLTTYSSVTWEINAALVSDTNSWVPMVQSIAQTGVGYVYFETVPGFSAWMGQPVVLQIIQNGPNGLLYQCAAIQFVAGGPAALPSGCTNSVSISIAPIVPAPCPTMASSTASTSSSAPIVTGSTSSVVSAGPTGVSTFTSSSNYSMATATPSVVAMIGMSGAGPFTDSCLVVFVVGLLAATLVL